MSFARNLRQCSRVTRALINTQNTCKKQFAPCFQTVGRNYTDDPSRKTVTLFPGHGIGPEISEAVVKIFDAAGANIEWETHEIGIPQPGGDLISKDALQSVLKNKVGLKGPLATPIGKGYRSLNITLRQALSLYANVRPAISIPAIKTGFNNVNVVVVRENTEGEYSGLEHEVVPGVVESLKIITQKSSMRIAEYAFKYAVANGRKKVSAVHKANIMKMSDGLFLECCRAVAKKYPNITYDEIIVDACCMKLVKNPSEFDVLVTPNLYGDIVSDLCAGLIGGLGLTPSGNFGEQASVFEAVHGTAPDIAGKNLANPTALLFSGLMMLRHINKYEIAENIQNAVMTVLREGKYLTGDLGGKATCSEYTNAIINNLKK
jgi:isocitrate dehydrogenase (NAD+)